MIEAVSGQDFEAYLRAAFFEPLGMTRTSLCLADAIIPWRARGYVRGRSGFHNARPDPTNWSHSAGGLCSTLDDLSTWDRALRDGRAIGQDTFARMIEPTVLADGTPYPYGLGWGIDLGDGRFLQTDDPETELRFSDYRDGKYHALHHLSPLWPSQLLTRGLSHDP